MSETDDKMVRRLMLGRYRIVQLLARGGMGEVYLARVEGAAGFAKPVVVKCILSHLSDSTVDRAQFIREAQILSNLQHPGIVNVIDFGKVEGAYLMVLEYVHGYNLGQWLKYVTGDSRQVPWESCILIMLNVLAALQYAHTFTKADGSQAAVIHRDISPGNILLDVDGNVRLADFGIARMQGDQTSRQGSVETIFRGKLSYAAPELLANEIATPSTDIYACGVVLYQMLSGTNPFSAEEPGEIINRALAFVPPAISTVRTDVPRGLDEVLQKAMAKDANNRYSSVRDFAAALWSQLRRTETEVATETAAMIRADFTGNLSRALGLQSLEKLDDAWRTTSGYSVVPPLSSMPPTVQLPSFGRPLQRIEPVAPTDVRVQSVNGNVPARSSRRLVLTVLATSLFVAGATAAVTLAMRRRHPATEPVVVSSSEASNDMRNASAAARAESADPPTLSASNTEATNKLTPSAAQQRDSLDGLSKTFARRQSAIENCFQSNALAVNESPQVSIHFSINADGKVAAAAVRPESVAATSLGSCLLQVASSTDFGPQDKALSFSIPITARAR